jgi:ketosteroid isomerase-like protein
MSQENVEIVRRVYDAVARHDTATVLAAYDPEVEWDLSRSRWGTVTGRGIYHGHADLRAFYRDWYEAWEHYDEALGELVEAGEHVIVVATGRGRGRGSGVEVEWTQYGVWTIRGGKIVRVVWFGTRKQALEAAGLSE